MIKKLWVGELAAGSIMSAIIPLCTLFTYITLQPLLDIAGETAGSVIFTVIFIIFSIPLTIIPITLLEETIKYKWSSLTVNKKYLVSIISFGISFASLILEAEFAKWLSVMEKGELSKEAMNYVIMFRFLAVFPATAMIILIMSKLFNFKGGIEGRKRKIKFYTVTSFVIVLLASTTLVVFSYRTDAVNTGWYGIVISILVIIGFTVELKLDKKLETSDIFGSANYAGFLELSDNNLVTNNGIPLGLFRDEEDKYAVHYAEGRHLITIAPTRSGKGTTAQIPTLLEHDAALFMIDPKGENAVITARCRRDIMGHKVFIVNPFGVLRNDFAARGFPKAARFNPLAALNPNSDTFFAEVSALCEALISTEGKDPHFSNSARDLVKCLILHVCLEEGETRTLLRVRELLTQERMDIKGKDGEAIPSPYKRTIALMATSEFPPLAQAARRFSMATNEMENILSTAITQTGFLDDPCLAESLSGDDFRFLDLKQGKMSVFLVLPANLVTAYSKWFRLLVVSALDSLMSTEEKGDKPVLMMLDEFASLGHLSSVENAMGLAAGFGVQLWPFVQDIHQLKDIYDKRWQSFLANVGIQQYFTPNDIETAEHISRRAGHKTVITKSSTTMANFSESESFGETGRPLITPDDLFGMPDNEQLLFSVGLKETIRLKKQKYMDNPVYAGRWDENPYFKVKNTAADFSLFRYYVDSRSKTPET